MCWFVAVGDGGWRWGGGLRVGGATGEGCGRTASILYVVFFVFFFPGWEKKKFGERLWSRDNGKSCVCVCGFRSNFQGIFVHLFVLLSLSSCLCRGVDSTINQLLRQQTVTRQPVCVASVVSLLQLICVESPHTHTHLYINSRELTERQQRQFKGAWTRNVCIPLLLHQNWENNPAFKWNAPNPIEFVQL